MPHNVVARSDDLEVIEINEPAVYGTWALAGGAGAMALGRPPDAALARVARHARRRADDLRAAVRRVGGRRPRVRDQGVPAAAAVEGLDRVLEAARHRRRRRVGDDAGDPRRLRARGRRQHSAGARRLVFALHGAGGLSGDRVPADRPEDRDRAAVHHLVRVRLHAEAAARVPAVVLPDRRVEHRRLQGRRPRRDGLRAHDRRGRARMFFKIQLPQALPHIFTGLKVGAALAATAAVVAEFVASDKGLGYLLLQYNGQLDTPMVFATIVILSLIGLAVYYAVEIVERIAIPVARVAAGDGQGRDALKRAARTSKSAPDTTRRSP